MINEEQARIAWTNHHMSDYPKNYYTDMYNEYMNEAKQTIDNIALNQTEWTIEQLYFSLTKYSQAIEKWINDKISNDSKCVAWFISGPANYPMKKFERWNSKNDDLMRNYEYIFNIKNYLPKKKRNEVVRDNIDELEYNYKGITVKQNKEANRLQVIFDGKPSENVRNILKSNGFKWSPSNEAWQRQLTENALCRLKRIIDSLVEE